MSTLNDHDDILVLFGYTFNLMKVKPLILKTVTVLAGIIMVFWVFMYMNMIDTDNGNVQIVQALNNGIDSQFDYEEEADSYLDVIDTLSPTYDEFERLIEALYKTNLGGQLNG